MPNSRRPVGPLYRKVQAYLLERIQSGEWQPTDLVPSENELVKLLGVSRMTVNRAVRELSEQGLVKRVPGVGTFVAENRAQGHLLEVLDIAHEIEQRGHRHSSRLLFLSEEVPPPEIALGLHLKPGMSAFHSVIVHSENGKPMQLEDRYVQPTAAPDYLHIDWATTTPSEYLQEVAPLKKVEHVVRAVMPEEEVMAALEMAPGEPCLLLLRRTWSGSLVASTARLLHPSSRYQLGDQFKTPTTS